MDVNFRAVLVYYVNGCRPAQRVSPFSSTVELSGYEKNENTPDDCLSLIS